MKKRRSTSILSRAVQLGDRRARLYARAGYSIFGLALAIVVGALQLANVNAWGPVRQTYTMAKPADHITFNSITDSVGWGDERNMVLVKDLGGSYEEVKNKNIGKTASQLGFKDNVPYVQGHAYMIMMRVHNNAAENLNLVAKNVRASLYAPSDAGTLATIQGIVSADNCGDKDGSTAMNARCSFWDEATIGSDKNGDPTFKLVYKQGTGRYYTNDGVHGLADGPNKDGPNGFVLPDEVWTPGGTKLGYDRLDGNIKGCYKYSGFLTFIVEAQPATPTFSVIKGVRPGSSGSYNTSLNNIKPGSTLEYQIYYKNLNTTGNQYRVTVADDFATGFGLVDGGSDGDDYKSVPGLSLVANTSKLQTRLNPNSDLKTTNLSNDWPSKGLNAGSYTPGAGFRLFYSAKVPDSSQLQCGENEITNTARITVFSISPDSSGTVTDEMMKTAQTRIATSKIKVVRTEGCNDKPETPPTTGECAPTNPDGSKNPKADSEECNPTTPGAPGGSTPNGGVTPGVPNAGVISVATVSAVLLIGCAALMIYWLGSRNLKTAKQRSGAKGFMNIKINFKK